MTKAEPTHILHDIKLFIKNDSNASFIAGGVAGAISRTVVSPFERAKILLQLQGQDHNKHIKECSPQFSKCIEKKVGEGYLEVIC